MRILIAGCNHKTAPLAIREQIAFDAEAVDRALKAFVTQYPRSEAMLVSTCNRVEFYVARPAHNPPDPRQLVAFLADSHSIPPATLERVMYQHEDVDAARHLMSVAGSLDSMVLGETQILGQVREAFRLAQQAGTVGPVLTRLCQDALSTAKRIHTETGLSTGKLSVASVAAQFAQQIFSDFRDKTVMIVGAGEMGELTLDRLVELGAKHVLVVNRSRERADALAARYHGEAMELDRLDEALTRADVVVTSTGTPHPIITAAKVAGVMKARRYRPLFLIDIAVPRDVEPEVTSVQNVYAYNIDDLQDVVEANAGSRAGRVVDAQFILEQQVEGFMAWLRARALGPTIAAFCKHLADLRADELEWLMPKLANLPQRERDLIEQFSHRLVSKVMHDPVRVLTEACGPDSAAGDVYAQVLAQLFGLKVDEDE
ncbi:MAG: glutamyl-tRNA reductase [Phycisphaerae bacterium]|nr:glutamyl-tRNA reductase [Phycisphaerae bacterium]